VRKASYFDHHEEHEVLRRDQRILPVYLDFVFFVSFFVN